VEGLQSRGVFADFCAGVRECSLLDLTLVGSGAGDANRAKLVRYNLQRALRCIVDPVSQRDCRGTKSRRALGLELPLAEFGEGDSQRTWA